MISDAKKMFSGYSDKTFFLATSFFFVLFFATRFFLFFYCEKEVLCQEKKLLR